MRKGTVVIGVVFVLVLALAAVGFAGAEPGGKSVSAKEGAILTVIR